MKKFIVFAIIISSFVLVLSVSAKPVEKNIDTAKLSQLSQKENSSAFRKELENKREEVKKAVEQERTALKEKLTKIKDEKK